MKITEQTEKLSKLGLTGAVFEPYLQPWRFYHTVEHLHDIYSQMQSRGLQDDDALFLATIYHDIVYDPQSSTNEEDSAQYFQANFNGDDKLKQEVTTIILDTKTHQASSKLSALFCEMDLNILMQPFNKLMVYEQQIFQEFQFVDFEIYRAKRVEVLKKLSEKVNNPDLQALISYVEMRQPKIAVYPGSFNPFHKGHYNILQKAEKIFDKVIIARGINPGKDASTYPLPGALSSHQMENYDGLLTDFIDRLGYDVSIIRGLRNATDLQYELNQYRYLQEMTDRPLQIVSIFCDREFEHISSTGIRQLEKFGKAGTYLLD